MLREHKVWFLCHGHPADALRWQVAWSARSAKRGPPPVGRAEEGRGNAESNAWIVSGPGSARSVIAADESLPAAERALKRTSVEV